MDETAEPVSRGADPQQAVTRQEQEKVLELSLRFLSHKERAALVLRDLEGLSLIHISLMLVAS